LGERGDEFGSRSTVNPELIALAKIGGTLR